MTVSTPPPGGLDNEPPPLNPDYTLPAGPAPRGTAPSDLVSDGPPAPAADAVPESTGTAPSTFGEFKQNLALHYAPPDLWTTGRPPIEHSWRWALYGEHIPDDQLFRTAARVVIGFTIPFRFVVLYLDWLLERPSRALAAAVLIFVLIQVFF